MQDNKITLSDKELQAIVNSNFFFVKQSVISKVVTLFGEVERELKKNILLNKIKVEQLNIEQGKIFRGENYCNLPYVVLDFPKLFSQDSVFAFRSMFLWGKEFSFTLHLQGNALDISRKNISANIFSLIRKDFYFCVNKSPWQYNFEKENYILLDTMLNDEGVEFKKMIQEKPFIKLSRRISVNQFEESINFGSETFSLILKTIL